jgi:hypothetical protein
MDHHLSKTMGIKSDRGLDDDGLQVIIPAFYGGDRHVISMVLWVERPGEVAEVSLKYKDLVKMSNTTDSTAALIPAQPLPLTGMNHEVREVGLHQWSATQLQSQLRELTLTDQLMSLWHDMHNSSLYMIDFGRKRGCKYSSFEERDRLAFMYLLTASKLGRALPVRAQHLD